MTDPAWRPDHEAARVPRPSGSVHEMAGAHRLGAACETAAWPYGDRRIGPKPFISQRHMLGPADYAHARRGENVDGRR